MQQKPSQGDDDDDYNTLTVFHCRYEFIFFMKLYNCMKIKNKNNKNSQLVADIE